MITIIQYENIKNETSFNQLKNCKMKSIKQLWVPWLLIILVSFGISPHLMGQGSQVFSTPGATSFTAPPGVVSFTVKLWGAGGGGGNTPGTEGQGGGGGGAFQVLNVTNPAYIGVPISINVGAGGVAGNPGGNSTFGGSFSAAGGSGSNSGNGFGGLGGVGVAQTFSDVTSSFAWSGGNGGASTNPQQTSFGGGGGGRADNGNNGGNGTNGGTSGSGSPGLGGSIGGGNGGNTGGAGANASSYGGGGGGRGFNGATSGTGGNGRVEITWVCPTISSLTYLGGAGCAPQAGFAGAFAPANWTTVNTNGGNGTVNTSGAPNSVILTSSNLPNSAPLNYTNFQIPIPCSGVITLNWNYSTADVNGPYYDPFGYSLNGVFYKLTADGGLSAFPNTGANNQSGSTTIFVAAGQTFALSAGATDQILGSAATTTSSFTFTPAIKCDYSSPLTPTVLPTSAIGGTYSSPTLTGFLNPTTGAIAVGAPQGTHVVTYGWPAFGGCPAASTSYTLVIGAQAFVNAFTYPTPLCSSINAVVSPNFTATGVVGSFSYTGPGTLGSFSTTTGSFNPATSTAGSYIVSYTVPVAASGAGSGCNPVIATAPVTITTNPTLTAFDYPGDNTYCAGEGIQTPTSTVTNPNNNAISYSYTTSPGLTLNTTTGAINPATSTPGVYIVTMTIAAGGGCAAVTATSTVEILARPTATIAYTGNPFCQTVASTMQPVVISGVTGGPLTTVDFTATPAGLTINSATGAINLNSTPGVYTVKYRFTGLNGCLDSSSTSVTIKPRPTSTISYTGANPICSNVSPTVSGNVTAVGPWTLTLSNGQTATGTGNGPWSIVINDLDPGETNTYTVTALMDANCAGVAVPDMPGAVTITKRTITSGSIPTAANVKVCEGQAASVNVTLTSPANNCAPNPQFSGVFRIEKWNGAAWVFQQNYPWTITVGPSTTSIPAAISIPASILINNGSTTLQYRVSWVSLVDCNGCAADPLTGSVVVEVVPSPLITVSAGPTGNVCPGTNIVYDIFQAPGSTITGATFNWVATDAQGNVLGGADNVAFGNGAINTNLGLSCPYNNVITFTITPLNPNCCNCLGIPIIRTVAVRDIIAPTWTTGATALNQTLQCSNTAGIAAAQALFPVATDNCDNNVTNIVKVSGAFVASQTCPQAGTYTNTWTVTDDCLNVSAVFTQVITIIDTQAPTWTTAPTALNQTLQCSNTAGIAAAQQLFPVASDNCDANVTNIVKVSGAFVASATCPQAGTYTNTWTVTDDCGNVSAVFTQVITIIDTQAPTWVTAPTALNGTFQCSDAAGIAAAQLLKPVAVDNCDQNVLNLVKVSGAFVASATCPQAGTYTNTWTVADDCGNVSAVFTQVITVIDTQAPTWVTLPNALNGTFQCSDAAGIAAAQLLKPVAVDNCDANVLNLVKVSGAFVAGSTCPQAGTYTNTWTVADDCGNVSAVFTQVITIIDTQAPTWVTAPTALNQTLQCSNSAGIAAAQALFPVAVDNCDASVTNLVKVAGAFVSNPACPQAGTYTNTWTVRDDCQNLSTVFTQVITVIDNTAPVLTGVLPVGAIEINGCIGSAPVGPTAAAIALLYTDNCGTVTVTKSGTPTGTNCAWSVTYTYLVKDNCGNTVTPSPSITYSGGDVSAPVFTNVIDTQVINTGAGANCSGIMPDYRSLANVTDCGTFILEQLAPNAPGTMVFGFNGTRNVVIRATDACGNVSTTTFVVELKDLTAPVALCKPYTVILNANGTGSIVLANINNGSYDNCTPTSQLVFGISQTNFTCANVGTNNVILTITDLCNNVSTCTAVVTVIDNTAPVISCFGDTTINKDANCTYTMPDLTFRVNKADACGFNTNSVTQSIPVGSIFGASVTSIPVTLTVTDKNGNSSTCTFTINFADVTPPVISGCPQNITVFTGLGNALCSQTATWTPPTATDACIHCCSTQPITGNFAPGATFPVGVTTVTYTATDVSGNTSTCSFTVTVIDNTRPLIANCPANISLTTGAGSTICGRAGTWTEPTATDNCTASANLVRTRSHAPGFVFPVGVTTVTYTFADAAGNVSLPCSFTVTVTDNTVPVFTSCPSNIVNPPINTAGCVASVVTPNPTFTDNCGVTKLTWALTGATTGVSPTTGVNYVGTKVFNFGVTTVTYTATDAAGNTATCTYTVTVTRPLVASISGTSTVLQNANTTSTIGFTSRFGTAPYTIVYTTTAGGFPSAGTHTIITTNANSSTIGGDNNWLLTTVPQSNATPGVYTYTLVSVTDFYGCVVTPNTTAVVTVINTDYPAPDLTPSVASMGSLLVQPASTSLGYIDLYNVAPNPTTGAISLEVYNPANFNLVIGATTTSIGSNVVNNNDFNIVAYPGIGYLITSKPGVVINADAGLKIGFQLVATGNNQTKGKLGIVLVNKTGGIVTVVGDNNNSNNSGAETFSIIN